MGFFPRTLLAFVLLSGTGSAQVAHDVATPRMRGSIPISTSVSDEAKPGIADIMNVMTGLVHDAKYEQGKCSNIMPWVMTVDYYLITDDQVSLLLTLECAETKMGMWVEPHRNASLLIQQVCIEMFQNQTTGNVYNWTQVMFHTEDESGEMKAQLINIATGVPDYSFPIIKGIPASLGNSFRYNYIATSQDAKAHGLQSVHGNYAVYRDENDKMISADFGMEVYRPINQSLLLRSSTEKTFHNHTTEYMINASMSSTARALLSKRDWKNHFEEQLACDRMKSVIGNSYGFPVSAQKSTGLYSAQKSTGLYSAQKSTGLY